MKKIILGIISILLLLVSGNLFFLNSVAAMPLSGSNADLENYFWYDGTLLIDQTTEAYSSTSNDFTLGSATTTGDPAAFFGMNNQFFNLNFDIGTLGTDGVLTWEYATASTATTTSMGDWAPLTVTDATSDFSSSGTVDFNIPLDWVQNKLDSIIALAGGYAHSLALESDGTVWAWGENDLGQLGDSTNTERHTPIKVSGLTDVTQIAAGEVFSVALKSDGTVWTWGYNYDGQLGDGTNIDSNVPVQVLGLTGVTKITAGGGSAAALKSDGSVWEWGVNNAGQLGDGTNNNSNVPVHASGTIDMIDISIGPTGATILALNTDNTVWAWGLNGTGEIGDNTTTNSNVPVHVPGLTNITQVAAGGDHSLALQNDGTVWAWGWNVVGQLGDGSNTDSHVPIQIPLFTDVTYLTGGFQNSYAIKSDNTLWAWGTNNTNGLCRFGSDTNVPVEVTNMGTVSLVKSGTMHVLSTKSDGTLWACGINTNGQLGDGTTTYSETPTQVNNLAHYYYYIRAKTATGYAGGVPLGTQVSATVPSTSYWFNSGADNNWSTLAGNWWSDVGHTVQALVLPLRYDAVTTIGTTGPNVDLDTWTEPEGINATATGITFTSATNNSVNVPITGNATFNNSSVNVGTVTGDAVFNDFTDNQGTVDGNACFGPDATNNGTVTGSTTSCPTTLYFFKDGVDDNWGTLTGNWWTDVGHTSQAPALPTDLDTVITVGTVPPHIDLDTWTSPISIDASATGVYITDNNDGGGIGIEIIGNASFHDTSYNGAEITGDVIFNDSSYNVGTISGNTTFNDLGYNAGTIEGDAIFTSASAGTLTLIGNQTWGAVQGMVLDSDNNQIFDYIFNDNSNTEGVTLKGNAVFNNNSYIDGGTVTGVPSIFTTTTSSITQTGATLNGNIHNSGTTIFNDESQNYGTISINTTFNDTSYHGGTVTGDMCFNDLATNDGSGNEVACPISTALVTERGFNYGLDDTYGTNVVQDGGPYDTGTFTTDIEDLTCDTTYHYRAYATNISGTTHGSDVTFDTTACASIYTLTYTAGANGSITGSTSQTVVAGDDGTAVTAVADLGYHFVDWSDAVTNNPRTDLNVVGDLTVTANFEVDAISSSGNSSSGSVYGSICKKGYIFNPITGRRCTSFEEEEAETLPISTTSSTGSCPITTTLRVSSRGIEVKCLQIKLNITSDGIFGPMTKGAVMMFQKNHNLVQDGIVGPLTRSEINK